MSIGDDPEARRQKVLERLHRIQGPPEEHLGNRIVQEGLRQMSLPGQYARGLLAGKPGEKASSEEMLESWGVTHPHPVGQFAWDVATDPLTYAGPGLAKIAGRGAEALQAGARALGEGPSANPLRNALQKFAAEESGKLDWEHFGQSLGNEQAREEFRQLGPNDYFKRRLGYGIEETPAHQFDILADRMGVPLHWADPGDYQALNDVPSRGRPPYASYFSEAPGKFNRSIAIPTERQIWWNPEAMEMEMARHGNPAINPAYDPTDVTSRPTLSRWFATADPRHLSVHELVHAIHHREMGTPVFRGLSRKGIESRVLPELEGKISRYATTNPLEAVAEIGTKGLLRPPGTTFNEVVPGPVRRPFGREWWAPDMKKLEKDLGLSVTHP